MGALGEERAESESLTGGPVDALTFVEGLLLLVHDKLETGVHDQISRDSRKLGTDVLELT